MGGGESARDWGESKSESEIGKWVVAGEFGETEEKTYGETKEGAEKGRRWEKKN